MQTPPTADASPAKPGILRRAISRLNFFPRSRDFFRFFEGSATLIAAGAGLLRRMIAEERDRETLARALDDLEHEGDRITHEAVGLLHKTFLTPIDREDIHRLVNELDDVMDSIHTTANRLTLYHLDEIPPELTGLADIIVLSADEIGRAVALLRRLSDPDPITQSCIEIGRLEHEADDIRNHILRQIFRDDRPARQLIQVKELLENLERTTDRCKDVAVTIRSIVLKHA